MSGKVIEFMTQNPDASSLELFTHFATEMDIDTQIQSIKQEVDRVMEIREELRPLYGEKMNLDANLAVLESEFDMQVMMKYPPRQGSDKERKAYKKELQLERPDFQEDSAKVQKLKISIEELEEKMSNIQQGAKNARRMVDTFNTLIQFVMYMDGCQVATMPVDPGNKNLF